MVSLAVFPGRCYRDPAPGSSEQTVEVSHSRRHLAGSWQEFRLKTWTK